MGRKYPAIFHQEEDGFTVTFPDLLGCVTCGDTLDEAQKMAAEALALYLDGAEQPTASCVDDVVVTGQDKVLLVEAADGDDIVYFS